MSLAITLLVPGDDGEREVRVEPPEWTEFTIGRGESTNLFLNHPTVSRRHCRLVRDGPRALVEDLGSRVGTFVNGKRVSETTLLDDGDRLTVGEVSLGVRIVDAEAAARRQAQWMDTVPPPRAEPTPEASRAKAKAKAAEKATDHAMADADAGRPTSRKQTKDSQGPPARADERPVVPAAPPVPPAPAAPSTPSQRTVSPPPERPPPDDRTVVSKGGEVTTTSVSVGVASKTVVTIGRAPECDVVLDNPLVTRRHAELRRESASDPFTVTDLHSTNGTFVNGDRVKKPRTLAPGDALSVGPYALKFDGKRIATASARPGTRIEVRGVGKQVNDRATGKPIYLLKDIALTILPREFVGFLGSSGCGKSTFMDTVNGRRPATEGTVLFDGENLYNQFDRFKRGIGYVPQELIFHDALPVAGVLRYASRLRLPDDTTDAEIESNIDRVVKVVGLVAQKETLVKHLSGGQKKRVSIAMELLSRPTLLFLDEATSGLDLGTEAQMMRLFRDLADDGVTTLCITHFVDSLDACDMVAYFVKGRLGFYGPPSEMKAHFGVAQIRDIYVKELEKTPEEWEAKFQASAACKKYVVGRASPAVAADATRLVPGQALEQARPADPKRQFRVLTRRYVDVIRSDRRAMWISLLMAPVIALLVSLVLAGKADDVFREAQRHGKLSFVLTITTSFLGLFGAIREVVKELPVYRHERFINLEILPYLLSKVIPLAAIGGLQVAAMLLLVDVITGFHGAFVGQFVVLWALSVASSLLGLAISSAVDSSDKAVLLMVAVVIPQILFGNAFIELSGVSHVLAMVAIVGYWGHDGLKSLFPSDLVDLRFQTPVAPGPENGFQGGMREGGLVLFGHNGWFLDLVMLLVFCGVYGALAYSFLRKKDGPTGKPFGIPLLKKGTWVLVRSRLLWFLGRLADALVMAVRAMTKAVAQAFEKKPPPAQPS